MKTWILAGTLGVCALLANAQTLPDSQTVTIPGGRLHAIELPAHRHLMTAQEFAPFRGGYELANGQVLHLRNAGSIGAFMYARIDDQEEHRIVASSRDSFVALDRQLAMRIDLRDDGSGWRSADAGTGRETGERRPRACTRAKHGPGITLRGMLHSASVAAMSNNILFNSKTRYPGCHPTDGGPGGAPAPLPDALRQCAANHGVALGTALMLDLQLAYPGMPAVYGKLLSADGHFIHFEMDLDDDLRPLPGSVAWDDISASYDLGRAHKRGTGMGYGLLCKKVLQELNHGAS